ncbi:phage distal tail protein [Amycolatopsis eburnea]|uniref:Phage tail protein n=1 Tax=Amycolatopsis eburnea TaxID=2267691 RepID=A0A427TII9_9PSEU|nr:phage tail domain-containing protein [Amycolatopsis eburnea]RSD23556.1 phage tail protein [Amycolatopsis eburnea]
MGGETLSAVSLALPVYEVDGWAGNVVDADGVEWWVTKEDGWSTGPGVRLELSDRPQRDGAFDAPSFRSARVITLEGTAVAPDEDAHERAKDRIAAVLADGSVPAELVVRERTVTRRALVRLSAGTKVSDTTPVSFDWSLQVTAPDPLRYGEDVHELSCGLPEPGQGITFPLRFPLVFGQAQGGTLALVNAGTATTRPVWTITGPCTQPVIRNDSTGERLAFSLSLAEGDVLTVDTAARTVFLGTASRRSVLQPRSSWFGLPPGSTAIGFEAFDDGEAGTLTVRWRDAWI